MIFLGSKNKSFAKYDFYVFSTSNHKPNDFKHFYGIFGHVLGICSMYLGLLMGGGRVLRHDMLVE